MSLHSGWGILLLIIVIGFIVDLHQHDMLVNSWSCHVPFSIHKTYIMYHTHNRISITRHWPLFDSNKSDVPNDKSQTSSKNEFEGFNPFIQKTNKNLAGAGFTHSSTVSLRKMQMNQLMETLLRLGEKFLSENNNAIMMKKRGMIEDLHPDALSSSNFFTQIKQLLIENDSLLLEPIVGGHDTPLESDSIYHKDMTTAQRFDEYDRVMKLRQVQAQNEAVKLVLWAMCNYVQSRRRAFCEM